MNYNDLTPAQAKEEYAKTLAEYEAIKAKGLKLNMARGKPSKQQLDLVSDILTVLSDPADCVDEGIDARNYGELAGLPCARKYFADVLGCKPEQVFAGGSASLTLMYDLIAKGVTHGLKNSEKPWGRQDGLKWLCPAPGYDRHFKITESFGFELITIPMTESGPDMDKVEEYIKDPKVKGIWTVPKYSNPDGIIYSDETIRRLASMKPAAPDFALIWDNAYGIHEFAGDYVPFPDILSICAQYGNADMVYEFASTSKITLPGAGISCMACSEANMKYLTGLMGIQMISYDKINQLRHVKYLKDKAHTLELMKKHATIMGPKFKLVVDILDREIAPRGLATWHDPKGGYFVSVNVKPGCAKRTWALCKEAGVVMTDAGATFPYGKDPQDSNIRVAPSLPPLGELEQAMEVFCVCLRLAALEQMVK